MMRNKALNRVNTSDDATRESLNQAGNTNVVKEFEAGVLKDLGLALFS